MRRSLSRGQIRKILLAAADGEDCPSLAKKYGVSYAVMWQIVNRTTYRDIPHPLGRLEDLNIRIELTRRLCDPHGVPYGYCRCRECSEAYHDGRLPPSPSTTPRPLEEIVRKPKEPRGRLFEQILASKMASLPPQLAPAGSQ